MIIADEIYGDFEVDGVIKELIQTKEIQRLKNVHQGGASFLINEKANVTRFEHSVGVMILIKILGASVEEQIAGLLHDVSHTAFSHVIDYVLEHENEDYHEKIYKEIIDKSDIIPILKKYNYDYNDIINNHEKWTLLEKECPYLCADRIDYTLRDIYRLGKINKDEIKMFLSSLITKDNLILINDINMCEWFVSVYYEEVINYFRDINNIYANQMITKSLKQAIKLKIISIEDFNKDDYEVLSILNNSRNKDIIKVINSINDNIYLVEDEIDYDIMQVNKLRVVDPMVFIDKKITRGSLLSEEIKNINEKMIKISKKPICIKILG